MVRVEHAAVAIVLLVAFVADLRFVVPVALGVLLWWTVRHRVERVEMAVGAALLAASSIAFAFDSEVAAWALTLTVAVLAGVSAARPTSRARRGRATRAEGSSSRGR
jgi:hypothetical protein